MQNLRDILHIQLVRGGKGALASRIPAPLAEQAPHVHCAHFVASHRQFRKSLLLVIA
jgi:hypothetical protein